MRERVTADDLSLFDPEEKLNLLSTLVDSLSFRQKSSLLNRVADSLVRHSIVVETVPPKSSGPDPSGKTAAFRPSVLPFCLAIDLI